MTSDQIVQRLRPYYVDPIKQTGHSATMVGNLEGGYVSWEDYKRLCDIIATIMDMMSPVSHPETKQSIGFHMCFVRDADVPLLQQIAQMGDVRRA